MDHRNRETANELLVCDYFAPDSLYDPSKFEECFLISINLFLRIARYFEHARGKRGFTTIQKYTVTLRQLRYSIVADVSDEYLKNSFTVTYICDIRLKVMWNIYVSHIKLNMVSQGCLVALIVHIESGQIVPTCGVVNSREVIMRCRLLY
uniref:Uncharacterized protein n=1 Tax=Lactuca sativa TaxID=4236 RepID=A0A9R1UGU8_LACSA|nr:hypothetical protein LSAT_V11C900469660 [Lactuca sativa]